MHRLLRSRNCNRLSLKIFDATETRYGQKNSMTEKEREWEREFVWSKNAVRIVRFFLDEKKMKQKKNNNTTIIMIIIHACVQHTYTHKQYRASRLCVCLWVYALLLPLNRMSRAVFFVCFSTHSLNQRLCANQTNLTSPAAGPISVLMFEIGFFFYKNEKYFSLPAVNGFVVVVGVFMSLYFCVYLNLCRWSMTRANCEFIHS